MLDPGRSDTGVAGETGVSYIAPELANEDFYVNHETTAKYMAMHRGESTSPELCSTGYDPTYTEAHHSALAES